MLNCDFCSRVLYFQFHEKQFEGYFMAIIFILPAEEKSSFAYDVTDLIRSLFVYVEYFLLKRKNKRYFVSSSVVKVPELSSI